MLHTKPQCQWPFGSGEEDFWRAFTIYERGGHLVHVTQTLRTNFRSPIPLRLHMKFGFDWPSGFEEEDLWKWWTDDGAWLYYKLINEPKDSGELKNAKKHTKMKKISKLRDLEYAKPRDFWKILNYINNDSKSAVAPLQDLYNYFKNINTTTNEDDKHVPMSNMTNM